MMHHAAGARLAPGPAGRGYPRRMERVDAVVLGGGPAGLGAALHLARSGARPVLIEAGDTPGGLCATRRRDGLAYDIGGHIPFVRDRARHAGLAELLDGDLGWVGRPVSCILDGRITRGRYLDQQPGPGEDGERPAADGSAWGELAGRVGAAVVERAMRRYLEKVDGVPLEHIPATRARRLLVDQAAPDGFWYPRGGSGQLMEAMAAAITRAGGRVVSGVRVREVAATGGRVSGVVADGPRGELRLSTEHVVAALPPPVAARLMRPEAPPAALPPVRMRACAIVYLALERDRLTPEPWIQVDDPAVPFARMFEPANWSDRLVPAGRTVLGCECYCRAEPGDPVWSRDDPDLAEACAAALATPLGLLDDPDAARPLEVVRLPRAYPEADLAQMPAAAAPAEWLAGVHGMHLAVGGALIEAVEAGERAAAQVIAARDGAGAGAPPAAITAAAPAPGSPLYAVWPI